MKYRAMAAAWFSTFLLKAFISPSEPARRLRIMSSGHSIAGMGDQRLLSAAVGDRQPRRCYDQRLMFDRFSETARRTLFFARYEIAELGGTAIEPEHILLGLLRADKGATPWLFARAGLSYSVARSQVMERRGGREHPREHLPASIELPIDEPTQRVLNYAVEEADDLGHQYINTEHLVLGLLREEESFAADILRRHEITMSEVRKHIVEPPVVPEPPPTPPAEGTAVRIKLGAFDPVTAVEQIRYLTEELWRSRERAGEARTLVEQIGRLLDALKQHLAGS
jgi:hypothetical protein